MKLLHISIKLLIIAVTICFSAQSALAFVPVRISIKFIVDAGGNRPSTGNINTNAEINGEVNWGNTILQQNVSEHRLDLLELYDLTGVSGWYNSSSSVTNRNNLRTAAIAAPGTYGWRTDAINVYINAGTSSAISDFPPNNNIILVNQNCGNNPSCLLHEIGHSVNLYHTHSTTIGGGDGCADTIPDNQSWTRNQISQNSFGCNYSACTTGQQDQVDLVFNNIMSYHTGEQQLRVSECQMDRESAQAYSDAGWLLSEIPVYVNSGYTGSFQFGTFIMPYKTVQAAVTAGLANRVLVIQQGTYPLTSTITDNTTVVPRVGSATIDNGAHLYTIPVDLEESEVREVRDAVRIVRSEDKSNRKVMKAAEKAAKKAAKAEEKASIMADAREKRNLHKKNAVDSLMNAERFAGGEEKVALQLELAQRYRDDDNCVEAIEFFNIAANATTQPYLRDRALLEMRLCQDKLDDIRNGSGDGEEQVDHSD